MYIDAEKPQPNAQLGVLVATLVVAAIVARLVPHPPNFTPVGAAALFAGCYFSSLRLALGVPLVAMLVSDIVLGLHATLPFVYAATAASVLLGRLLAGQPRPGALLGVTLASTAVFFVVTNLGVWLLAGLYPPTVAGLVACFVAAIPFLGNSLAANIVFTAMLFGAVELTRQRFPRFA